MDYSDSILIIIIIFLKCGEKEEESPTLFGLQPYGNRSCLCYHEKCRLPGKQLKSLGFLEWEDWQGLRSSKEGLDGASGEPDQIITASDRLSTNGVSRQQVLSSLDTHAHNSSLLTELQPPRIR